MRYISKVEIQTDSLYVEVSLKAGKKPVPRNYHALGQHELLVCAWKISCGITETLFSKLEKGNLLATFVLWSFGQNLVSSFWSKRVLFIAGQTILKILIKYIKHETQCFITRWYTEKRVENTTRGRVFLTNFEVFHLVIKRFVDALIYYINIFRIFWPAINSKRFRGSCFKININLFEL